MLKELLFVAVVASVAGSAPTGQVASIADAAAGPAQLSELDARPTTLAGGWKPFNQRSLFAPLRKPSNPNQLGIIAILIG